MANPVPQFIADEGKRLKSNNDPYWTRLTANMENVLLGYPPIIGLYCFFCLGFHYWVCTPNIGVRFAGPLPF